MRRLLAVLLLICPAITAAEAPLRVFAAASLGDVIATIGQAWEADRGQRVTISLAGTATLARQIAAGAPADVFLSANAPWMRWVEDQALVDPQDTRVFASNRLVMIAPARQAEPLTLTAAAFADRLAQGRLAMGAPDAVPAGIYGKAALTNLGLWEGAAPRVAGTDSVRAALALVALGAAPLGLVYATDALAEPRVATVADIPEDAHPPITYHAAPISDRAAARAFIAQLVAEPGQAALRSAGFAPPPE